METSHKDICKLINKRGGGEDSSLFPLLLTYPLSIYDIFKHEKNTYTYVSSNPGPINYRARSVPVHHRISPILLGEIA